MTNYKNKQGGLIKMIIIIVIAIIVLSWYGVDIKEFLTSPQVQKNFGYISDFIKDVWADYLSEPAQKIWGIWIEHVWKPLTA
jgi:hypothetical protein